jgi:outer membrane receptor protein involved in Fe transport
VLLDDAQFGSSSFLGLGNSRYPDFDPSMLERVEVLRGPQGTLYGASSLGGLIKYVTRQPDTQQFSGRVEVGGESIEGGGAGWSGRGYVNLPLWADRAALSLSAFDRHDPGYLDNVRAGNAADNVNTAHTYGGHAALLLKPIDGLSITLTALEQKRNAEFATGVLVNTDTNGVPNYIPTYGENKISLANTSDVGNQQFYSGRIQYDFGDFQIMSLTSWNKSAGTNINDVTSVFGSFLLPAYGLGAGSTININDAAESKKFAEELRVSGKVGSTLDWRMGLFYTKETAAIVQSLDIAAASGTSPGIVYTGSGPYNYWERAVFGDFTYHVTEKFAVEAGARYATNDQEYVSTQVVDPTIQPIFGPNSTTPVYPSKDNATTWQLSPSYHFTPDLMAYVRVATGYRPGGPNTVVGTIPATFAHDTVTNYELGIKGLSSSKTFGFDIAIFQINWKDIQLQDTDTATQFVFYTNGGTARSRGLEAAINWKPLPGLAIDANATFLDAVITESLPMLAGTDTLVGQSGDRLPASAKFSSNLSAQYDWHLNGSINAFVGANWSFIGARESTFVNSAAVPIPRFTMPSYSDVDLRAGLEILKNWQITMFVRNILNENGVVVGDNRNGTSVTTVNFLQPRTIGGNVAYSF